MIFHFSTKTFSRAAGKKILQDVIGRHKFYVGKNFEAENFPLLTMIDIFGKFSVRGKFSGNGPLQVRLLLSVLISF
jgi:hypothetical protein